MAQLTLPSPVNDSRTRDNLAADWNAILTHLFILSFNMSVLLALNYISNGIGLVCFPAIYFLFSSVIN